MGNHISRAQLKALENAYAAGHQRNGEVRTYLVADELEGAFDKVDLKRESQILRERDARRRVQYLLDNG